MAQEIGLLYLKELPAKRHPQGSITEDILQCRIQAELFKLSEWVGQVRVPPLCLLRWKLDLPISTGYKGWL